MIYSKSSSRQEEANNVSIFFFSHAIQLLNLVSCRFSCTSAPPRTTLTSFPHYSVYRFTLFKLPSSFSLLATCALTTATSHTCHLQVFPAVLSRRKAPQCCSWLGWWACPLAKLQPSWADHPWIQTDAIPSEGFDLILFPAQILLLVILTYWYVTTAS